MNSNPILFEEKQFLGFNKYWLSRRLVLALFCFIAYFLTENNRNGELFLVVGGGILFISVILTFFIHFKTCVFPGSIILDGLWSTKRVKVDFNSIVSVEKTAYSKYMFNNPVYNQHKKGTIRFYTRGKEAIKLTDRDGLVYIIGSQRADELVKTISSLLGK